MQDTVQGESMQVEHQQAEANEEERPHWWWISERTHPEHGLDFEEYRRHHDLWVETRAEWQERKTASALDGKSRRTLIERLAESLPGPYTGPFDAVANVKLGLVETLLEEDVDFNPLVELDQVMAAVDSTQDRLRSLGIHICVEVDPESEMDDDDDSTKSYEDFSHVFVVGSDEERLTIKDACRELGITTKSMHNHIARKRGTRAEVPAFKVGRQLVMYRRDFEEWRKKHYHEKFAPKRRHGQPAKDRDDP